MFIQRWQANATVFILCQSPSNIGMPTARTGQRGPFYSSVHPMLASQWNWQAKIAHFIPVFIQYSLANGTDRPTLPILCQCSSNILKPMELSGQHCPCFASVHPIFASEWNWQAKIDHFMPMCFQYWLVIGEAGPSLKILYNGINNIGSRLAKVDHHWTFFRQCSSNIGPTPCAAWEGVLATPA